MHYLQAAECLQGLQADQGRDLHPLDVECHQVDLRVDQVPLVLVDLHHLQEQGLDRQPVFLHLQDRVHPALQEEHNLKWLCNDQDHKEPLGREEPEAKE